MDTVAAIARTSFSLVAVLGLLYLITRWLRRRNGGAAAGAGEFAVLSRQSLGAKASVALVKVGDRALVVGVSEQGVSLLGETAVATVFPQASSATATGPAPAPGPASVVLPADDAAPLPVAGERYTRRAGERLETAPARSTTVSKTTTDPVAGSAITGSALSPATWTKAVDVLRERTTRR